MPYSFQIIVDIFFLIWLTDNFGWDGRSIINLSFSPSSFRNLGRRKIRKAELSKSKRGVGKDREEKGSEGGWLRQLRG